MVCIYNVRNILDRALCLLGIGDKATHIYYEGYLAPGVGDVLVAY